MNIKLKIALFAVLCLISAAVFAKVINSDESKKEAGVAAANADAKQQRGSSSIGFGKGGSGSGGGSGSNTGNNNSNNSANQPAADDLSNEPNDPGTGQFGISSGSPLFANADGCTPEVDSLIVPNSAKLTTADPRFAVRSCDFNIGCTEDVIRDSGEILKHAPQDIVTNSLSPWTAALSFAWNLFATQRPQYKEVSKTSLTTSYTYSCIKGETSVIAGDNFRKHSTQLGEFFSGNYVHSAGRVYIKRCCANARCPGGYFDFAALPQQCKSGPRPNTPPAGSGS
ncbi:MAG: hypothetical protein FWF35_05455 [Elusimicrobia bacterium]|nr:hypothetical protein [Elusimicrobiota bacterium]